MLQGLQLGPALWRQAQIEAAAGRRTLDQKHQQTIPTAHQAQRLELRLLPLRARDDAHQPGEIGQAAGEVVKQIIESRPLQTQFGQLPLQLQHRPAGFWQQCVHKLAVALRARHTPGRGMRLGQQSLLLQRSHGRAHGCRGGIQTKPPHQGATSHRLHRVDVVLHRGLQHLLLAARQRKHERRRRP